MLHPISFAVLTVCSRRHFLIPTAFPDRIGSALADRRGGFQTLGGKIEHCLYVLLCQTIEHLDNLVNAKTIFKIFEDCLHRYASATKHPSATDLARNAFHCCTL
jgi:hypothetical protein